MFHNLIFVIYSKAVQSNLCRFVLKSVFVDKKICFRIIFCIIFALQSSLTLLAKFVRRGVPLPHLHKSYLQGIADSLKIIFKLLKAAPSGGSF